ncbi:MAG: hypothetical protein Ct9H300mP16_12710 [Pseudomonadota bacterium]|nr:MAG: hypothetical protein Ct9H300mP16_12710 [Pseudomonadota bacterium]
MNHDVNGVYPTGTMTTGTTFWSSGQKFSHPCGFAPDSPMMFPALAMYFRLNSWNCRCCWCAITITECGFFYNVCRHRGHLLVAEPCQLGHSLRCPYHSWTYALDGSLIRTPNIGGAGVHQVEGFDLTGLGLVQVRCAVWHDLVFINLDGSPGPFDEFFEPLEKRW